jgi:hypothetical protein
MSTAYVNNGRYFDSEIRKTFIMMTIAYCSSIYLFYASAVLGKKNLKAVKVL